MSKRAVIEVLKVNTKPMVFSALHGNISCSSGILNKALEELQEEGVAVCEITEKYVNYKLKEDFFEEV